METLNLNREMITMYHILKRRGCYWNERRTNRECYFMTAYQLLCEIELRYLIDRSEDAAKPDFFYCALLEKCVLVSQRLIALAQSFLCDISALSAFHDYMSRLFEPLTRQSWACREVLEHADLIVQLCWEETNSSKTALLDSISHELMLSRR
jgi:hypothetical protein